MSDLRMKDVNSQQFAQLLQAASSGGRVCFCTKETKLYQLVPVAEINKSRSPLTLREITLFGMTYKKELMQSPEDALIVADQLERMGANKLRREQKLNCFIRFILEICDYIRNFFTGRGFRSTYTLTMQLSIELRDAAHKKLLENKNDDAHVDAPKVKRELIPWSSFQPPLKPKSQHQLAEHSIGATTATPSSSVREIPNLAHPTTPASTPTSTLTPTPSTTSTRRPRSITDAGKTTATAKRGRDSTTTPATIPASGPTTPLRKETSEVLHSRRDSVTERTKQFTPKRKLEFHLLDGQRSNNSPIKRKDDSWYDASLSSVIIQAAEKDLILERLRQEGSQVSHMKAMFSNLCQMELEEEEVVLDGHGKTAEEIKQEAIELYKQDPRNAPPRALGRLFKAISNVPDQGLCWDKSVEGVMKAVSGLEKVDFNDRWCCQVAADVLCRCHAHGTDALITWLLEKERHENIPITGLLLTKCLESMDIIYNNLNKRPDTLALIMLLKIYQAKIDSFPVKVDSGLMISVLASFLRRNANDVDAQHFVLWLVQRNDFTSDACLTLLDVYMEKEQSHVGAAILYPIRDILLGTIGNRWHNLACAPSFVDYLTQKGITCLEAADV